MDEKVYNLASSLNEELNNNPLVKQLNELDKELNDNYEVFKLSNKKDEALEQYLFNKDHYGENHELTIKALKELSIAKEKLNTHPLVKKYLEVYSKVRDLYMQVNDIILSDYIGGNKACR